MKHSVVPISVVLLIASIFTGCETTPPTQGIPTTLGPVLQQRAQRELKEAWRLYENKEYHQVIPNVQHILSRYPNTRARTEGHYLLALAYYQIEGYPDAVSYLIEYISLDPDGKYADESRGLIQKVAIAYEKQYPSDARILRHLVAVEALLKTNPSVGLKLQEADLNWQLKRYAHAGELYIDLLAEKPALKQDLLFNRRIEMHDDNTYTVLTPDYVFKKDVDSNPIVVSNTHSFRASGNRYQHPKKYYVVTGEVTNRSDKTLQHVELFTTIYGFGHIVYDTTNKRLGRMQPGETRAFSFRFQNFDNIDAVSYHESKVTFQR